MSSVSGSRQAIQRKARKPAYARWRSGVTTCISSSILSSSSGSAHGGRLVGIAGTLIVQAAEPVELLQDADALLAEGAVAVEEHDAAAGGGIDAIGSPDMTASFRGFFHQDNRSRACAVQPDELKYAASIPRSAMPPSAPTAAR